MKTVLASILTAIFIGLSMIHFYWAFGGQWGFDSALPTSSNGVKVLNPSVIDCIIVGVALLSFGMFYTFPNNWFGLDFASWFKKVAKWTIPLIFLLRAIGDFKYVGFFKSVKVTEFASLDTLFFSPLCLTLGLVGILWSLIK